MPKIVTVREYFKFIENEVEHTIDFKNKIVFLNVTEDLTEWLGIPINTTEITAYIWEKYGSMLMVDSDPINLRPLVALWHKAHRYMFKGLADTMNVDYNPLFNRDLTTEMTGERTPDIVKSKTGTEGTVDTRTEAVQHGMTINKTDSGTSSLTHGHTVNTTHGHIIDTHREMKVATDDKHSTDTLYGKTTTTSIDSEVTESVTTYDDDTFNDEHKTVTDTDETQAMSGKDTESFAGETNQTTEADFHIAHSGTDNVVNGGVDSTVESGSGQTVHSGTDTTTHGGGLSTTHNISQTESGSETRTQDTHSYGKIGQTSYQTLIEKERKIRDFSLLDLWCDEFAKRFFIPVWETFTERKMY